MRQLSELTFTGITDNILLKGQLSDSSIVHILQQTKAQINESH